MASVATMTVVCNVGGVALVVVVGSSFSGVSLGMPRLPVAMKSKPRWGSVEDDDT